MRTIQALNTRTALLMCADRCIMAERGVKMGDFRLIYRNGLAFFEAEISDPVKPKRTRKR